MDLKFESHLLIILSYFDEIYGPQVLEIYPRGQSKKFQNILSILTILIDVSAASSDDTWKFLYADENFASQNIRISVLNPDARGGISDVLISLILVPPHPQHIAAMGRDWNNIYYLQELISELISFNNNIPEFGDTDVEDLLSSVHKEIIEQFQFFLDLLAPNMHTIS